ncbi:hypothetical protein COT44_03815 [Candidatus Shapirobacteria bacterium CG08_land_8_20_14_0_20_39_18]|uniref:Uncharacterized protein n=1 Tax=Candidatus Shapirobacteria bacterium CG08_land_8_20_14_0_20_39_18 TaxID=1974883 RepID=A0A2M6XCB6_9BACT|nr:MAG: hypothetical protein COT44_03815 [Candidatus Shapirobacteria bacterium CG08_land_8_20_14_0_20_39_18]PIY65582.1 MAG: hypothetical protein COY91_02240 [Candidatus Shapirobacteria bacterium CG_4_10_14_0_8_um_filter_39_15]
MLEKLTKIINRLILLKIAGLVFILPLFFLPLTYDFFEFNKNVLLVFAVIFLTLLWMVKMVINKTVTFRHTVFDLPILGIAAAFIISSLAISPNKLETLLSVNSTGTIIAFTLLFFLITNHFGKEDIAGSASVRPPSGDGLLYCYIVSITLLALISLTEFLKLTSFLPLTDWLKSVNFTPTGAILSLITILIPAIIISVSLLASKIKTTKKPLLLLSGLSVLIMTAALALGLRQLYLSRPILLSINEGWVIAIETLKQSPFWGIGPDNFITAFTRFHSLAYNNTNLWSIRFGISSNWYFQLFTTTGLFGLVMFLWLIKRSFKGGLTLLKNKAALVAVFVLLAILPPNFILLFTLYLLVAVLAVESPATELEEKSTPLPWLLFIPILIFSLGGLYLFGKNWLADYYFHKSLVAYSQNNGLDTYNWQIKAIAQAPYSFSYHVAYSQTNLALANALAGKKDLTDQDRQNISTLIQQAIREAKIAVSLDPQNVTAWENLALIYRGLINFAQDAENWTVASYQQTLTLDPLNPNLRVALGGVYFSLKNWDDAQRQFEIAVQLKPNFANAHYNLSATYREQAKFNKAVAEMQTTLTLVPTDSQDYQKAQNELEALQKKLAETAKKEGVKPSETLKPPQPAPTGIKPPLTLPTESAPAISPVPTAEPTPIPTTTP